MAFFFAAANISPTVAFPGAVFATARTAFRPFRAFGAFGGFPFVTSACTLSTPLESPALSTSPARTQRHSVPPEPNPQLRKNAPGSEPGASATRAALFSTCMVCRTCEKTCVTAPAYDQTSASASTERALGVARAAVATTSEQNPASARSAPARAASPRSVSVSVSVSAVAAAEGNSHSPPSRPPSGRFVNRYPTCSSSSPLSSPVARDTETRASTTRTSTRSSRFGAFFSFSGTSVTRNGFSSGRDASPAAVCSARPAQCAATGHAEHRGARGAHTVAPSSIMAWLKSPGRSRESSASATARTAAAALVPLLAASPPPRAAARRAATRITFPSTAATGSPNAMDATAAAVYGPTPGIPPSASDVRGKDVEIDVSFPLFFSPVSPRRATRRAPSSRNRARR